MYMYKYMYMYMYMYIHALLGRVSLAARRMQKAFARGSGT